MDREEELVEEFLVSEDYSQPIYEPHGNVPPDFAVQENIAIEARRLNENYIAEDGSTRGLEEDDIPLLMKVREVLSSFGPPTGGRSWFVNYRFQRPLPPLGEIASELQDWLDGLNLPGDAPGETPLSCGLEVWLVQASSPRTNRFHVGLTSDWDSGGWVLREMRRNIQLCLDEKTQKVRPYLERYEEWWLALVDYIGYGLTDREQGRLSSEVDVTDPWSRIIIINPIALDKSFDL